MESDLAIAFADRSALHNAIMHSGERGLGLDSSWRHKNEDRCPLTALVTVDEKHHMLPGAPRVCPSTPDSPSRDDDQRQCPRGDARTIPARGQVCRL